MSPFNLSLEVRDKDLEIQKHEGDLIQVIFSVAGFEDGGSNKYRWPLGAESWQSNGNLSSTPTRNWMLPTRRMTSEAYSAPVPPDKNSTQLFWVISTLWEPEQSTQTSELQNCGLTDGCHFKSLNLRWLAMKQRKTNTVSVHQEIPTDLK